MSRRKRDGNPETLKEALAAVADHVRPPVAVTLGSPREVATMVGAVGLSDVVCYQMDRYQAGQLETELAGARPGARVVTAPDLWDLPADFQTVLYPAPQGGERILKLDMLEQAFHVLRPRGTLVVISPFEGDQFFPGALKKIYGRVHQPAAGLGHALWCRREGDRPRRRHEVTFQARMEGPSETGGLTLPRSVSLRFVSRPGVFSYGRFDDGARALVETMHVEPGDRVLDVGCGCGTNGVWAGRLAGPEGFTAFADSNVRAVALADLNARSNGLAAFQAVASADVSGWPDGSFDVALANPPYYAQASIARLFIQRCRALLRPGGRFYLVTKQPDQVGPIAADHFGRTEVRERRGYVVLSAECPGGPSRHTDTNGDRASP
jgi:16S rRNA (guanine1207-N2)-methyltransferase